ncbi:MAG: protein kinase [Gemmatimonadales bacterium]
MTGDLAARLAAVLSDRYALGPELGRGGSAVVFRARDLKHDRDVAIKALYPELVATLAAERFLREIASTARLNHPHILPLLDSGSAGGMLFFVTPWLPGETLRDRLRREGQLPIADAVRIIAEIADGLSAAHEQGLVHRDIKPENILMSGRHIVIADFGVAKATSDSIAPGLTAGLALGTPTYMSPEQATADPGVDHRADLYALGVLGYELLAGRPPFRGATPQDTLTAHLCQTPEAVQTWRPDVPPSLADLVMRCLAKSPAERIGSAAEIVTALDPLTTPAGLTPSSLAVPKPPSRMLVPGLVAAVAIAGMLLWRWPGRPAPPPPVTQQMITFTGAVEEAALSPDGRMLALVERAGRAWQLAVTARSGGNRVELARAPRITELRWSAEGDRVFYALNDSGQVRNLISPMLGGPATLVTSRRAALAPDGRRVAIMTYTSRSLVIARVGAADSTVIPLPEDRTYAWALQLAWAPTSDRVAVMTTPTTRFGASFLVARVTGGPPDVYRFDSLAVHGFTWTPAGDTLLLLVRRQSAASLEALPLGREAASSRLVTIAASLAGSDLSSDWATNLTISRDGRSLTYVPVRTDGNVVVARVSGGRLVEERTLTTGTALYDKARLSPDRSILATLRREAAAGVTVTLLRVGGGPPTDLARFETATDLAWSPDGRRLAVIGTHTAGAVGLFLVERGGEVRPIPAPGPIGEQVSWTDSTSLLVQADQSHRFFEIGLTGAPAPRTSIDGGPYWVFDARARPGSGMVFYWNRGAGDQAIWWQAGSGAVPRRMASVVGSILGWSADGTEIAVAVRPGEEDGRLIAIRLADGATRELARTPPGLVVDEVAPDLVSIVGHRVDRRGDVLLVERR